MDDVPEVRPIAAQMAVVIPINCSAPGLDDLSTVPLVCWVDWMVQRRAVK